VSLGLAGPVALTGFEGVIESKPSELRLESGQGLNLNQNLAIHHNISAKTADHISAKIDLDRHFSADGEALRKSFSIRVHPWLRIGKTT
jgi:hypothetical protein